MKFLRKVAILGVFALPMVIGCRAKQIDSDLSGLGPVSAASLASCKDMVKQVVETKDINERRAEFAKLIVRLSRLGMIQQLNIASWLTAQTAAECMSGACSKEVKEMESIASKLGVKESTEGGFQVANYEAFESAVRNAVKELLKTRVLESKESNVAPMQMRDALITMNSSTFGYEQGGAAFAADSILMIAEGLVDLAKKPNTPKQVADQFRAEALELAKLAFLEVANELGATEAQLSEPVAASVERTMEGIRQRVASLKANGVAVESIAPLIYAADAAVRTRANLSEGIKAAFGRVSLTVSGNNAEVARAGAYEAGVATAVAKSVSSGNDVALKAGIEGLTRVYRAGTNPTELVERATALSKQIRGNAEVIDEVAAAPRIVAEFKNPSNRLAEAFGLELNREGNVFERMLGETGKVGAARKQVEAIRAQSRKI